MKILILVVCCEDKRGEYKMLSDTIKDTWGKCKQVHDISRYRNIQERTYASHKRIYKREA